MSYPKTYTCHPLQNWTLGRSGLEFERCILTINNQEEADLLTLQRSQMRPAQSLRIREVTVASLQMMLTGAAASPLPDAVSGGTNSETARLAMQAMKGQVALTQQQSAGQAPPIAVPQVEVVVDPIRAAIAPVGKTEPVGLADLMGAASEKTAPAADVPAAVPAALRLG